MKMHTQYVVVESGNTKFRLCNANRKLRTFRIVHLTVRTMIDSLWLSYNSTINIMRFTRNCARRNLMLFVFNLHWSGSVAGGPGIHYERYML